MDGRADRRTRILVSGLRLAAIERGSSSARATRSGEDLGTGGRRHDRGLAAAGAWSDDAAWWALFAALVATWVSGLDYARVAPRVLRGESA